MDVITVARELFALELQQLYLKVYLALKEAIEITYFDFNSPFIPK